MLSSFRLIAFDLPGHGLSSRSSDPMEDYTFRGYIRILSEVILKLQLKKFILVGNSMGGHIALEANPSLADCLGVFAMTMPVTKPIMLDKLYLNGELLGRVYINNPAESDVLAYAQSLLRSGATDIPDFVKSDFYKTDPNVHQAIVQMIVKEEYEDETKIISTTEATIAIVVGAQEQVHDLTYLDKLSLPVWKAHPLFVSDAGHLLQWENSSVVNQWLYSFAEECMAAK
jgi:pimeloyl-ACP methyl ester carboxylesterase